MALISPDDDESEPDVTTSQTTPATSTETDDLLQSLAQHRWFLRFTVRGLTDEQARTKTTVGALHLAGLIKHVADTEAQWVDFCVQGSAVFSKAAWAGDTNDDDDDSDGDGDDGDDGDRPDFTPGPDETLESLLAHYEEVASRTEDVVRALPDLGVTHELPVAPWWPAGGAWSARRALLHVIAETAQHSGHADILRESLDGQQTMA